MPDPNLTELIQLADDLRKYKQTAMGEEGGLENFVASLEPDRQSRFLSALGNVDIAEGLRKGQDPFSLVAGGLLPPGASMVSTGQAGTGAGLPLADRPVAGGIPGKPPKVEDFLTAGGGQGNTKAKQPFVEPSNFPYFPTTREEAFAFVKHGVPEDIAPYSLVTNQFGSFVYDTAGNEVTDPKIIAKVKTFEIYSKAAQELALRPETQLPRSQQEINQETALANFGTASRASEAGIEAGFRRQEIDLQDKLGAYRDEVQRRFQAAESDKANALRQGEIDDARKFHAESQKLSQLSLLLSFLSSLGSQPQLLYTLGQGGIIGKLGEAVGFDLSSLIPAQTEQTQLPNQEQLDQMSPLERQRLIARIAAQTGMSPDQIIGEIQKQAPAAASRGYLGGVPERVTLAPR